MKYCQLTEFLEPICCTPDDSGSWGGYYNYDVLNHDHTKMLSIRTTNDAHEIKRGMTVEVGYYDIPSCKWHAIGVSDSYNYPQGCMLQWLPGAGNEEKVIYNLSKDNHLIARIHDISSGAERDISWAIYGLTPDGKKSIALDLERSYWCRAYHYMSIENEALNVPIPADDGIFEIDLETNTRRRIVAIQDIVSVDCAPSFSSAKHWIEHIMISPSGRRFCFLHRFAVGDVNNYDTRLFIADIDGTNLQLITGWREYSWSHFAWDGDDAFTIYTYARGQRLAHTISAHPQGQRLSPRRILRAMYHSLPSRLRKELRILINGQTTYYQYYELVGGYFVLTGNLTNRAFDIDGHPSFTNDGEYMITDSYPDDAQYHRLIVYNKRSKKALIIGRIYAGLHNKFGTCDLHPKLCADNNILVVDSAYDGRHHMLVFRLNWQRLSKQLS